MASTQGIGLDFLCGLGMPPVDFIRLASRLGCGSVTLAMQPLNAIDAYAPWSLRGSPGLVANTRKALADHGITLAGGEGWFVLPKVDLRDSGPDLDVMAELGAEAIGLCGIDRDLSRCFDQIAAVAEMAAERGMATHVEFVPSLPLNSLAVALDAVAHAGRPECGVVIDAMHLFRSGADAAEIAAIDPRVVRRVQVCDVPMAPAIENYGYETNYERLRPGEGDLPLGDLLAAAPADAPIGLEIPMKTRAEAGEDMLALLAPAVEETRRLLNAAGR